MGTTYTYIQNAGSSVDWNGELDFKDNQGNVIEQRFNWTLPGGALTGLFPADPLSTTSDDVQIGPAGGSAAYQVTISQSDKYGKSARAQNLSVGAGSSLTLLGGDQGAYSNFVITSLTVNGNIHNAGQITVNTDAYHGSGIILQTATTLDGGGKVTFNDISYYSNSGIFNSSNANVTLTNVNNEINGRGEIETASVAPFGSGTGILTFINHGIVNANAGSVNSGPGSLTISTGSASIATINDGVFEATGPGTLVLKSLLLDNRGGQIYASDGAKVSVYGTRIEGGALSTTGTGKIILQDGASILDSSLANGAITNAGTLVLTDGHGVVVKSGLHNTGSIEIHGDGAYSGTDSLTLDGNAVFDGGGAIHLSTSNFYSESQITNISGQSVTFTNMDNTIDGVGRIYSDTTNSGSLSFVNKSVFNATGTLEIVGAATTNTGVLKATGTGNLQLNSLVLDNRGGQITIADGAKLSVYSTRIEGGSITTAGTAKITFLDGASVLDGSLANGAITSAANIILQDSQGAVLKSLLHNAGSIEIHADNAYSGIGSLRLDGNGVIDGGGAIHMSTSHFYSDSMITNVAGQSVTFTNTDNTIDGVGTIGGDGSTSGALSFINKGVVNATGAFAITGALTNTGTVGASTAGTLTIATGAAITNDGVLKAAGGRLVVSDAVLGTGSLQLTNGGSATFTGAPSIRT